MKWSEVIEAKNKYDKNGFLDEYLKWGRRLLNAYTTVETVDENYNKVLIMGMGGSGIVGDIIKYYLEYTTDITVNVYKDWRIPQRKINADKLIFISFSGNTIETLEAFKNSLKKINPEKITVITTDGALQKIADENKVNKIIIEKALAPRSGLPQLLGATIKIFRNTLGESLDNEIKKISRELEKDGEEYYIDKKENRAYNIAYHIWGRYPIFYGSTRSYPILARAKAMINENSKLSGYYQVYPEGYHNEVEIFDEQIDPVLLPLIIRWSKEEDIFKPLTEFMEENEIEFYEIIVDGETYLEYLMKAILLLDMSSIYLAYLTRRDPLETKVIKIIKGRRKIE